VGSTISPLTTIIQWTQDGSWNNPNVRSSPISIMTRTNISDHSHSWYKVPLLAVVDTLEARITLSRSESSKTWNGFYHRDWAVGPMPPFTTSFLAYSLRSAASPSKIRFARLLKHVLVRYSQTQSWWRIYLCNDAPAKRIIYSGRGSRCPIALEKPSIHMVFPSSEKQYSFGSSWQVYDASSRSIF
jgi:hypothetical protein